MKRVISNKIHTNLNRKECLNSFIIYKNINTNSKFFSETASSKEASKTENVLNYNVELVNASKSLVDSFQKDWTKVALERQQK